MKIKDFYKKVLPLSSDLSLVQTKDLERYIKWSKDTDDFLISALAKHPDNFIFQDLLIKRIKRLTLIEKFTIRVLMNYEK